MTSGWDPRTALGSEADRARRRLADLEADHAGIVAASVDSNADDEHDPEGATIAFERSQVVALARQAQERLREVAAALDRLERGRYGVCETCGRQVPAARLQARPTARTCVGCVSRG